jgi:hypothetical protein
MADREDLDGGRHPGDPQDLRHQRRGITDGGSSAVLTLTPGDAGKEIHTHHTHEHHVGQVDHETVRTVFLDRSVPLTSQTVGNGDVIGPYGCTVQSAGTPTTSSALSALFRPSHDTLAQVYMGSAADRRREGCTSSEEVPVPSAGKGGGFTLSRDAAPRVVRMPAQPGRQRRRNGATTRRSTT